MAMPQHLVNPAVEADEIAKVMEMTASGKTVRSIARELGISVGTVQNRKSKGYLAVVSPKVEAMRAEMDDRLAALMQTAMDIVENSEDADIRMKAIDRVIRIIERQAKLHGVDAPIKVDAVVTQQTEQEAFLASQFEALDRVTAARESMITQGE